MSEIKKILEEQLEREKASAKKDLNMLSSMVMDSDFAEERKEIQRQIKKLAEM